MNEIFDICIIGGGINGCGIARDAAGRGYRVLLLEAGDFASGTSSKSTKLIHGGLRYLENYEFAMVRKSLRERDVLMNLAPHIIWPMRFILPHVPHLRPLWMIRVGLWIYDFLAGRTALEKSKITDTYNDLLNNNIKKGIAYSDCWVEDSRLVVLNAMDAAGRGAVILRDTPCKAVARREDMWSIATDRGTFHAHMIVNAAGAHAAKIIEGVQGLQPRPLRLVKGSHLIVPRIYDGADSFILQNDDGRIVFAIPYEGDYTLIGTTDVDVGHDPDREARIGADETDYLLKTINYYFNKNIQKSDIVDTFSGVRPLVDAGGSAAKVSRDYTLDLQSDDGPPFLSVLGGKLTTYRVLAQETVDQIDACFGRAKRHWTADEKLPGGDIPGNDVTAFIDTLGARYPFLDRAVLARYARAYGTRTHTLLDGASAIVDMGEDFDGGLFAREIDYLRMHEFAVTAEDILWRRSKLGLHLDRKAQARVKNFMNGGAGA